MFARDDRVTIKSSSDGTTGDRVVTLTGTVQRTWGRNPANPNVTVRTDDGRTFVRLAADVEQA
jgi:hypothetical protein